MIESVLNHIKVVSSHGHFVVTSNGTIKERHDTSGELPRVARFNMRMFFAHGRSIPPDGIVDILHLGYWTTEGTYEPVAL